MEEYKIELDIFEGPLDLLLYLIKKEEIDIYDIPIEQITQHYLKYLDLMKMLDLNIAGEFIVMAATLLHIKSKMLLPVVEDQDEDEDDPRGELVKKLLEYKKFKEAADMLCDKEEEQESVFKRMAGPPNIEISVDDKPLADASIFDLLNAFSEVLRRAADDDLKEIFEDEFSVGDKVTEILQILSIETQIRFSDLFPSRAKKTEVIVTFLAMLEMIKRGILYLKQDMSFGEIIIYKVKEDNVRG